MFASASAATPEDTNGAHDVFVKDLRTGAVTRMSTGGDGTQFRHDTYEASVSNGEGSRVRVRYKRLDLVPGDINDSTDVFVKDLTTGQIVRATTTSDGREVSQAMTFRGTGWEYRGSSWDSGVARLAMSDDGRTVAFVSPATGLVP